MPTVGAKLVGIDYQSGMETLGSRIRSAREKLGLSQEEVAAAFAIRRVSVTQWENDTTRPALSKIARLATLLHTTPEWLVDGQGSGPSAEPKAAASLPASSDAFKPQIIPGAELVGVKDFPIFAAAEGGNGHLVVNFDAIEVVKRPSILEGVKGAYGLLVYGDSMSPAYRHGDMALVHPGLREGVDEDVVLYDHALHSEHDEVEAIIKHLVTWSDMEWTLEQYNPPRQWRELRADWPTCHRVVGKYGRRR